MRRLTLSISELLAGRQVRTLLRRELGLSAAGVRRAKDQPDGILLDGQPVFTNVFVQPGQVLSVAVGDVTGSDQIAPVPGPLALCYEDEDLLIVNKPGDLAVHPSLGHHGDTLANFLMAHYEAQHLTAAFHPVNRLDRGTSGLLAVAKHAHAQEVLKNQLHTAAFRREYLAVCRGAPSPAAGVVDAPLGPKPGSLVEQMVRPDGKDARTRYETLSRSGGRSLVRLELDTGRTHQIRVHMASLGCPLTGDFLYGYEDRSLISRPALHSAQLSLRQPVTGQELSFTLPLPEDMARLLTHQKGEKEP